MLSAAFLLARQIERSLFMLRMSESSLQSLSLIQQSDWYQTLYLYCTQYSNGQKVLQLNGRDCETEQVLYMLARHFIHCDNREECICPMIKASINGMGGNVKEPASDSLKGCNARDVK